MVSSRPEPTRASLPQGSDTATAYAPSPDGQFHSLDWPLIHTTTNLVVKESLSIVSTCRLVRGQTVQDNRPNKALNIAELRTSLQGFPDLDIILDIAHKGDVLTLQSPLARQTTQPANHPSASEHLNIVVKNQRQEQNKGGCVIVKNSAVKELWRDVHVSPIGVVEKSGKPRNEEGRVIHDLSHPKRHGSNSINARTDRDSIPQPEYINSAAVVKRVLDL